MIATTTQTKSTPWRTIKSKEPLTIKTKITTKTTLTIEEIKDVDM